MLKLSPVSIALMACTAAGQTQYESPAWSPDGHAIVFVAKSPGGNWNIERAAIDGAHRAPLTRQGAWDPAWSPGGNSIAFVSTIDGKRQISIMSPDGANVHQLTHGPAENFHPAWSRDGLRLACTSANGTASRIVVMNSDGSAPRPVTPPGERARWPSWSPDAARIAYYKENATPSLRVVTLATGAESQLFGAGITRTLLDWSPDGKQIAFIRGTGNNLGINVLEIESGTVRRILGSELGPGEPRWSPNEKKILISTHSPPGIAMLNVADSTVTPVIK